MRSSRWHAHGNVYIVHEGDGSGVDATGTDGVLEVLAVDGDDVTIGILNTDGSRAEMSGNGTRIAAAWLMARTGSDVARVHVGDRTVAVRRTAAGLYESDTGGSRGRRAGGGRRHRAHRRLGRQPARGRARRPRADRRARAAARDASALPGADERAGRAHRRARRGHRARLGARRGGDERLGNERVAVAAATHGKGEVVVHFPGGDLRVLLDGTARGSPARRSRWTNRQRLATKPRHRRSRFADIVDSEGGGTATPPLGGGVGPCPRRT